MMFIAVDYHPSYQLQQIAFFIEQSGSTAASRSAAILGSFPVKARVPTSNGCGTLASHVRRTRSAISHVKRLDRRQLVLALVALLHDPYPLLDMQTILLLMPLEPKSGQHRFDLLLPDVLAQPPRPERELDGGVFFERDCGENSLVGHDGSLSADDADGRRQD